MPVLTFFTPKYKLIIHVLVITFCIWGCIDSIDSMRSMTKIHNYHEDYEYIGTFKIIVQILTFFIMSWWLIPLFIKNKKKGGIFITISIIAYTLCATQLNVYNNRIISGLGYESVTAPNILSHFKCLFFSFLDYTPLIFLSIMYSISITDKTVLKENFTTKQLEIIVNIIVVLLIFQLFILNTGTSFERIKIFFEVSLFSLFFYINTIFIGPILLREKKIGKYLFLIIISFILIISGTIRIYGRHFLDLNYTDNLLTLTIFFSLTFIFSFVYGYFRIKIVSKEKLFTLKLGAKDSELKLLKSQVNPHFLFNTLNTLYGTALEENASKTAESTAKLANLIRYMQEDINKDFIPLENEIKYLQDYIIIQELRCAIKPQIETEFKNIQNHNISPGLLIPFVENAFKYGIDPSKSSKLSVSIICDEKTINFKCINSYDENFKTYYKEQGFGIGIKNAKQRLELVYPKKHTFKVVKENHTFSVYISINAK